MDAKKACRRLVVLMKEKGVDINGVSVGTHIDVDRLSNYLSGDFENISVNETVSLSKYFDISPSYLMGWVDYRELKYTLNKKLCFTYRNMLHEDADKQFVTDLIANDMLLIEKID